MNDGMVVELRQYTLVPGQRDVLIEIFERSFIEGQEAVGIQVIDHFRDLDDPNGFVWLRGFPDMAGRARTLEAFYTSPVWYANRAAANATLLDTDNVLLLRPAREASGPPPVDNRPPVGAPAAPTCLVVATICHLDPAVEEDFVEFFEHRVAPEMTAAGATILASYVTEHSANNYPRLPIREDEHVFIWFARFPNLTAYERHRTALAQSLPWNDEIAVELEDRITGEPQMLRLVPTARSPMHA